MGPVG